MHNFLISLLTISFTLFSHQLDFSELVKKQTNSVVNIEATRIISSSRQSFGSFPEELFREFGLPMPDYNEPRGQQREAVSTGSGFVFENEGYVVTNFHVVQDAVEVVVKFHDRQEFRAEIIGLDELSDIALLKIKRSDLSPVSVGNSDLVEQGDGVIAIGSPYNYDFSVTFGIISATGRGINSGRGIGDYVPYLQTDAAVNRGNSGGPLFNTNGEVIGINSQIYSRSGGNEGLAFAIPMNVAVEVIDQLKSDGRVSRGYLGVQGGEVSSDLAKALGMKKPIGAHIRSVLDGGAADKSGILPGDVILAIDDDEVVYFKDLQHTIGRTKPNTEVVAQLFREGALLYLDVTVGELPVEETQVDTSIKEQESAFPLGLRLEELETGEQKRDISQGGLRVTQVFPNSPAFGQIFRGDVINKIVFKQTTFNLKTVGDFTDAINSFNTGDIILIIGTREGANIFEPLEIE